MRAQRGPSRRLPGGPRPPHRRAGEGRAAGSRPYEFVVLSDHGQSQGATFRQRHGQSPEELIRELVAGGRATVTAATNLAETAGPANTLLSRWASREVLPAKRSGG